MRIYREDRRCIRHLGGLVAMRKYRVVEWAEKGSGRFRKYKPLCWDVPDKDVAGLLPIGADAAVDIRNRRHAAGVKAANKVAGRRLALAMELGIPPTSRTVLWLMRGDIDRDEAERIARICRHRHESTDYDALLAAGYDKDTARELMREVTYEEGDTL